MDSDARIALIMTFRDEAANLPLVLASLAGQTLPRERLLLVAVDNGSLDDGAAVVRDWLVETGTEGQVLTLPRPSIPAALNAALGHVAPHDYVVRIDAHTLYAADYLETILRAFENLPGDVWCVGGSPEVTGQGSFGRELHVALFASPMGLGAADYRSSDQVRQVASVYLGAWRPGVLHRLGGYDEAWQANEDAELAERVREGGGRVFRVPARSRKVVTRGAYGAFAQWTRYGWWRAQTFKRHPGAIRPRHAAPPAALVLGTLLAVSPARPLLVPLGLAYAAAVWARRPRGQRLPVTLASMLYFPLVQAGYGAGMLAGALTGTARNPRLPEASEVRAVR